MRIVQGENAEIWWCEEIPEHRHVAGRVRVRCIGRSEARLFDAPTGWQHEWSPEQLREKITTAERCMPLAEHTPRPRATI